MKIPQKESAFAPCSFKERRHGGFSQTPSNAREKRQKSWRLRAALKLCSLTKRILHQNRSKFIFLSSKLAQAHFLMDINFLDTFVSKRVQSVARNLSSLKPIAQGCPGFTSQRDGEKTLTSGRTEPFNPCSGTSKVGVQRSLQTCKLSFFGHLKLQKISLKLKKDERAETESSRKSRTFNRTPGKWSGDV